MKILQLTAYYPPSIGGIQYYVQSLSHYLSSKGHQVDILTINTEQSKALESTAEGVNVRRCKLDLSLYRALMSREFNQALMSATNYDAYHIHIPFHVGLEVAAAASKQNKIPLVATHHGQGLVGSPAYTLMAGSYSWLSRMLSLQGVDRTIFLTPSYAQSLWLPKPIRKRMRIVRTGADIERFSPHYEGKQIRQKYQIAQNAPLILFVGSLHKANRYKGVDYLLHAMRIVTEIIKDAKLMIVGGGELLAETASLNTTNEVDGPNYLYRCGLIMPSCHITMRRRICWRFLQLGGQRIHLWLCLRRWLLAPPSWHLICPECVILSSMTKMASLCPLKISKN